jgi:L-fucose mutarotase
MLRGRLTHPELLRALAGAGHGAKVLLADGNYPVGTKTPPAAARVYLNLTPGIVSVTDVLGVLVLTPGIVSVTDVLSVLVGAIPIEAAEVMVPASGPEPPVFAEFRRILADARTAPGTGPAELALTSLSRDGFYAAASSPDVAVAVATGERRIYANILLTIGVIGPDETH